MDLFAYDAASFSILRTRKRIHHVYLMYIAGLQFSERHLEFSSFCLLHSFAMFGVKGGVMHSYLRIMALTFYYSLNFHSVLL